MPTHLKISINLYHKRGGDESTKEKDTGVSEIKRTSKKEFRVVQMDTSETRRGTE